MTFLPADLALVTRTSRALVAALGLLLAAATSAREVRAEDPFVDAVTALAPGVNGGFGTELLPGIVLGPPRGGDLLQGSFDVVTLGSGGSIVVRFDLPVICDGPGADFTVFENAFRIGSPAGPVFTEFAFVAVSQDGVDFLELPYQTSGEGLAGRTPVESHPDNGISALDPAVSGGDSFDLADVGLDWAAYVRVTDVAGAIPDVGDLPQFTIAPNAGFELDAVAAVHACEPGAGGTPTASATPSGTPIASATAPVTELTATPPPTAPEATSTPTPRSTSDRPTPTATTTRTASQPTATAPPVEATPTATPPATLPGDLDGDGRITAADATWLAAELYDGDGDTAAASAGGHVASGPAADTNGDQRLNAADLIALAMRRSE